MRYLILAYFQQHSITKNNIRLKFPPAVGALSVLYAFSFLIFTILMKTGSLPVLTIAHTNTVFFT